MLFKKKYEMKNFNFCIIIFNCMTYLTQINIDILCIHLNV